MNEPPDETVLAIAKLAAKRTADYRKSVMQLSIGDEINQHKFLAIAANAGVRPLDAAREVARARRHYLKWRDCMNHPEGFSDGAEANISAQTGENQNEHD